MDDMGLYEDVCGADGTSVTVMATSSGFFV